MDDKVEVGLEAKFQQKDLKLAIAFADAHEDDFDRTFIDSLAVFFDERGYLTDKQHRALLNVIEKWSMEDWAYQEGLDDYV